MKTLSIIGLGPRGLYALEQLFFECYTTGKKAKVIVFEPSNYPGASWVWSLEQPETNWININERSLKDINERPNFKFAGIHVNRFPSYHEWSNFNQNSVEADSFPPRKKIGTYLHQRFISLKDVFSACDEIKLVSTSIKSLKLNGTSYELLGLNNITYDADEVLLCIGHQPTQCDKQLNKWKKHEESVKKTHLFEDTYPLERLNDIEFYKDTIIAVRGFGLAMIDAMRAITKLSGGYFKIVDQYSFKMEFVNPNKSTPVIVPFSLDGMPLAPKPLNKIIDDWFKPTREELHSLKKEIDNASSQTDTVVSIEFLTNNISQIVSRVFMELRRFNENTELNQHQINQLTGSFLKNATSNHELFQDENIATETLIENYINMALGVSSISLDYCIWQVWRHCQPTMYLAFSHSGLDDKIMKKIIDLDERSKRFSYGPPIASMQQLLALVKANILDLRFVNNPEIKMKKCGWKLYNSSEDSICCGIMINSVIDAPELLNVNSLLIKTLLKDDIISPVHCDMGVHTNKDGYILSSNEIQNHSIAVLGRLAKGSVMGVDAILECFGPRIQDWAKAFVKRL